MNYSDALCYAGCGRSIWTDFAICNVTSAKMLHFRKCLFQHTKHIYYFYNNFATELMYN